MSEVTDESTQQESFPATLDLSGADTAGNRMDGGWKDAVVTSAELIKTENPDGNLPVGTLGLNAGFTIDGGPFDNRKVWNRYWFPPASYDETKRARSLGMFVRFLVALGYDENDVKTNGFDLDSKLEELIGKKCMINTRYDEEYDNNKVNGVKARSAASGANESGAGLL